MGLRMGEAHGAATPEEKAARAAAETAEGVGDRKSFGDIGDLTGVAPDEAIPEYAASFEAEPESGIARTVDAVDETPSGIVLVADVVAPDLLRQSDVPLAYEAHHASEPPATLDLAPHHLNPSEPSFTSPIRPAFVAISDSQGGLNASRASLDGLTVLERYDGGEADDYASMPGGEAASGIVDVVPEASVEIEIADDVLNDGQLDLGSELGVDSIHDIHVASAPVEAVAVMPASVSPRRPTPAPVAPVDLAPYEKVNDDDERPSTPIARVSISRMSAVVVESMPPAGTRRVQIALTVSPSLLGGCDEAFVTLTLADGKVVHEGTCNAQGQLTVSVVVPGSEDELRALLDTGSKYKNARIKLAETGITEYLFR